MRTTRKAFTEACAKSLRDFGYPDVTQAMADECLTAWLANRKALLPHGVVGMFLGKQFAEATDDHGADLSALK